jgi:hypothetical protein
MLYEFVMEGKMRNDLTIAARAFCAGLALLLVSSCASVIKQGYEGAKLPTDRTAVIQSGPYTDIEGYDGTQLGSRWLSIAVLPGRHAIEVAFPPRLTGNAFYYSDVTGLVTFDALAGHRYVAYAYLVSPDLWIAYVSDRTSGERVAQSELLPLKVEWLYRDVIT